MNWKKLMLCLCLITGMSVFGQAKKLMRQADRADNVDTKIELYSQALELEPENLDALFYRALAKTEQGDISGAIVDYSKIILIKPDPDTYFNRGNLRYSLKEFEGAKEDYQKAYELDPGFVDALFSLACVKFDLGDYQEAIKDYTKVIELNSYYPKVYTLRASAYEALEDYKKAIEDYTVAVFVFGTPEAYMNRGQLFLGINYYKEAYIDFNKAISLDKNNPFGYFYRGTAALMLGGFDDAAGDFQKALSFDPNDFDALLGLSLAYLRLGNTNLAKLNFEKAKEVLGISTDDPEAYASTFWYQNQYYFFVNKLRELQGL
ncbi:tetratricopeptide repeat protein [Gaetbulibacter aestuarii]|uniref:Tetratricopeptide repeat protein n=2 Tax=Gaetbulibacter aestuarii TaxID=1502358 RepID=A0ABW7MY47_9FLAO